MRAAPIGSLWKIGKWEAENTCQRDFKIHAPRTCSSKTIGAYYAPRLFSDGVVLKPTEMASELKRLYGVSVHYKLALAGRNHAIRMIYGDSDKSFELLPSYLHMLQHCNPGSQIQLQTNSKGCFEYAFMALSASINGFLSSCRPVIVVDGTHLKGKYKGVMFVAATKDGNEQIFPLVVGLGDIENDNLWIWFFKQLRRTFGCPKDLLIISDQYISIKKVVASVYHGIPHGFCIYHLQKNHARFGPDVAAILKRAACCYRTQDFDTYMGCLDKSKEHEEALTSLNGIGPARRAKSKCEVRRYNFLTSNCAESLNSHFRWARRLLCAHFWSVYGH